MSEQTDALAVALAKAQAAMTTVTRDREVEVRTKTGGTYKFKYATLDAIIEHVRKPLSDNGMWFTQTLENGDGKYKLITTLLHSSGQSLRSETPLLVENAGNQAFGSALTYMRRYALSAMLGIAADDDDDANSADGNTITSSKDRKAQNGNGAKVGDHGGAIPDRANWKGPLKITALKQGMTLFGRNLESCEDYDQFIALMADPAVKSILAQCEVDLPEWWAGNGADIKGARFRIEARKKELASLERV